MTRSALTDAVQITSDSSPRVSQIDRFIVHHAATTSLSAILSLFQPGGRTVSANYALGSDGKLVNTVDETRRAWTSASAYWDGRAVTIEVANSYAGDPWPVSAAAFDKLARLIADVSIRYGFAITDDTVLTHQELYLRYGASYATACPGGLQRRKAELLALARNYRARFATGGPTTPIEEGDPVKAYDRRIDARKVIVLDRVNIEEANLKAVLGGPDTDLLEISDVGYGQVTAHVYAKATPGEAVDVKIIAFDPVKGTSSDHFTERLVADADGTIMGNPSFQFPKKAGERWLLNVYSPSSNKNPVSITRLAADGILFQPK